MLGVSKPGALNFHTLFRLIPLILSLSRNLTLIYLPLSGSLDSLLCNLIVPTPGLVFFSTDATHAIGGIIIFVWQDLSFSELSNSSLSSLDPYSDYVVVNISLNDSSLLSFLNTYAPPIRSSPRDSRTTDSLSPSILPIFRNFFILGDCNYHHPYGTQKVFLIPVGRKYSIGSSPPTSSMTLIYLFFSIAPVAVAPLLTSPLLSPLLVLGDTSGPGFQSPTNSTNRPSFSDLSLQQMFPFIQFSESSLG